VRGYSQLIIIKALMDEVSRIERSRPDEKGNPVLSSFHPFTPKEEKSALRPKLKHRRRKVKKEASTNNHSNTNGDSGKGNGKGKDIERQSDSSSSGEEECDKFYPYHYFDYIAGTSTGGYVCRFIISASLCTSLTLLKIERDYAWTTSNER
jgi:hypothetical protein